MDRWVELGDFLEKVEECRMFGFVLVFLDESNFFLCYSGHAEVVSAFLIKTDKNK